MSNRDFDDVECFIATIIFCAMMVGIIVHMMIAFGG